MNEGNLNSVFLTKLQDMAKWASSSSLWPLPLSLSCCGAEMTAAHGTRYDLDRLGAGNFKTSPAHADLMIVAGTITTQFAPEIKKLYHQMANPKYVIAMGGCAIEGGPYGLSYNIIKGLDQLIPVDIYLPGCPPRPEALMDAIIALQKKIKQS